MRIHDPLKIECEEIKNILNKGGYVTSQFSKKNYNDIILSEIDSLCSLHNEKLEIRFYDHEDDLFDAGILNKISNVQALSLDHLKAIKNFSELKKLNNLKRLRLDVIEVNEDIFSYSSLRNLIE